MKLVHLLKLANYRASETYAEESKGHYRKRTTPVGQFPPNAFGLYDMHGNVLECCADPWHDDYEGATRDGSVWSQNDNGNCSLMRGGSWDINPDDCRSARRVSYSRGGIYYSVGFRVACGGGRA